MSTSSCGRCEETVVVPRRSFTLFLKCTFNLSDSPLLHLSKWIHWHLKSLRLRFPPHVIRTNLSAGQFVIIQLNSWCRSCKDIRCKLAINGHADHVCSGSVPVCFCSDLRSQQKLQFFLLFFGWTPSAASIKQIRNTNSIPIDGKWVQRTSNQI